LSPQEFDRYREQANEALVEINEMAKRDYKLGTWQHWAYDLEACTLTFSNDGVPRVVATIQAVGSTSNNSGTWMWGWANSSLPTEATIQLDRVKRFGERENLSKLTEPKYVGDEELGWEMAAIANRILKGKGVYRCPSEKGALFLVFTDLCFIDTDKHGAMKRNKAHAEVNCSSHIKGFETFVCKHLALNPTQKWFSENPSESNPWPDAWCEVCNLAFEEEGEWNGQNEWRMKIKLLCHRCYESARAKETQSSNV